MQPSVGCTFYETGMETEKLYPRGAGNRAKNVVTVLLLMMAGALVGYGMATLSEDRETTAWMQMRFYENQRYIREAAAYILQLEETQQQINEAAAVSRKIRILPMSGWQKETLTVYAQGGRAADGVQVLQTVIRLLPRILSERLGQERTVLQIVTEPQKAGWWLPKDMQQVLGGMGTGGFLGILFLLMMNRKKKGDPTVSAPSEGPALLTVLERAEMDWKMDAQAPEKTLPRELKTLGERLCALFEKRCLLLLTGGVEVRDLAGMLLGLGMGMTHARSRVLLMTDVDLTRVLSREDAKRMKKEGAMELRGESGILRICRLTKGKPGAQEERPDRKEFAPELIVLCAAPRLERVMDLIEAERVDAALLLAGARKKEKRQAEEALSFLKEAEIPVLGQIACGMEAIGGDGRLEETPENSSGQKLAANRESTIVKLEKLVEQEGSGLFVNREENREDEVQQ